MSALFFGVRCALSQHGSVYIVLDVAMVTSCVRAGACLDTARSRWTRQSRSRTRAGSSGGNRTTSGASRPLRAPCRRRRRFRPRQGSRLRPRRQWGQVHRDARTRCRGALLMCARARSHPCRGEGVHRLHVQQRPARARVRDVWVPHVVVNACMRTSTRPHFSHGAHRPNVFTLCARLPAR